MTSDLERCYWRRVGFIVFFALLAMLLILPLLGCAEDRYLTKEQDDKMREVCDPGGCAVIPQRQWDLIEKFLQMFAVERPGA